MELTDLSAIHKRLLSPDVALSLVNRHLIVPSAASSLLSSLIDPNLPCRVTLAITKGVVNLVSSNAVTPQSAISSLLSSLSVASCRVLIDCTIASLTAISIMGETTTCSGEDTSSHPLAMALNYQPNCVMSVLNSVDRYFLVDVTGIHRSKFYLLQALRGDSNTSAAASASSAMLRILLYRRMCNAVVKNVGALDVQGAIVEVLLAAFLGCSPDDELVDDFASELYGAISILGEEGRRGHLPQFVDQLLYLVGYRVNAHVAIHALLQLLERTVSVQWEMCVSTATLPLLAHVIYGVEDRGDEVVLLAIIHAVVRNILDATSSASSRPINMSSSNATEAVTLDVPSSFNIVNAVLMKLNFSNNNMGANSRMVNQILHLTLERVQRGGDKSCDFKVRPLTANTVSKLAVYYSMDILQQSKCGSSEASDFLDRVNTNLKASDLTSASLRVPNKNKTALEGLYCDSNSLSLFVAASLLCPSSCLSAAACIPALVKCIPFSADQLLPIVVHLLSLEHCEVEVKMSLLKVLPSFAAQHCALSPLMKVLLSMTESAPPLRPIICRVMVETWKVQRKVFRYLKNMLIEEGDRGLEARVSRAACVRDICKSDPSSGIEVIRLVQDFMRDDSPVVVALSIECVTVLCDAKALDFYSTYEMIMQRGYLQCRKKHKVLSKVATFMGCAAGAGACGSLPPIINVLWKLSRHKRSPHVRLSAVTSLSRFSLTDLGYQQDPQRIKKCTFDILKNEEDPSVRRSAEVLALKVLNVEAVVTRKAANPVVTTSNTDGSARDRFKRKHKFSGILPASEGLLERYLKATSLHSNDRNAAACAALLGGEVAPDTVLTGRGYPSILLSFLSDVHLPSFWPLRILHFSSWGHFVERLVHSAASGTGEGIIGEKSSRDLVSQLTNFLDPSTFSSTIQLNSSIAIGALAASLPPSSFPLAGEICDLLISYITRGVSEWVSYGAVLGLACAMGALHVSDSHRVTTCIKVVSSTWNTTDSTVVKFAAGLTLGFGVDMLYRRNAASGNSSIGSFALMEATNLYLDWICEVIAIASCSRGTILKGAGDSYSLKGISLGDPTTAPLPVVGGLLTGLSMLTDALATDVCRSEIQSILIFLSKLIVEGGVEEACIAYVKFAVAAYTIHVINNSQVTGVFATIASMVDRPDCEVALISLGTLYSSIHLVGGYQFPLDFDRQLFARLERKIKEGSPFSNSTKCAVVGLCNYLGLSLCTLSLQASPNIGKVTKGEVTAAAKLLTRGGGVAGETSEATGWCEGALAIATVVDEASVSVGTADVERVHVAFNKLPDNSLLQRLFHPFVSSAGNEHDGEGVKRLPLLASSLRCLSRLRLPAAPYGSALLQGLIRDDAAGLAVHLAAIQFSIHQVSHDPTLVKVFSQLLSRSVFHSLPMELQYLLLDNLPTILESIQQKSSSDLLKGLAEPLLLRHNHSKDSHLAKIYQAVASCVKVMNKQTLQEIVEFFRSTAIQSSTVLQFSCNTPSSKRNILDAAYIAVCTSFITDGGESIDAVAPLLPPSTAQRKSDQDIFNVYIHSHCITLAKSRAMFVKVIMWIAQPPLNPECVYPLLYTLAHLMVTSLDPSTVATTIETLLALLQIKSVNESHIMYLLASIFMQVLSRSQGTIGYDAALLVVEYDRIALSRSMLVDAWSRICQLSCLNMTDKAKEGVQAALRNASNIAH